MHRSWTNTPVASIDHLYERNSSIIFQAPGFLSSYRPSHSWLCKNPREPVLESCKPDWSNCTLTLIAMALWVLAQVPTKADMFNPYHEIDVKLMWLLPIRPSMGAVIGREYTCIVCRQWSCIDCPISVQEAIFKLAATWVFLARDWGYYFTPSWCISMASFIADRPKPTGISKSSVSNRTITNNLAVRRMERYVCLTSKSSAPNRPRSHEMLAKKTSPPRNGRWRMQPWIPRLQSPPFLTAPPLSYSPGWIKCLTR